VSERAAPQRVVLLGFSSGADVALRFAAARPGGGARVDGVLALGCNVAKETCFVTALLARMSSRHPERLLADLRTVGESTTGIDEWLTVHSYLVAMLRKFRGNIDPLRQMAREVVAPFEGGGSPFPSWFREASANVRGIRCVFEDTELYRAFVTTLLLEQPETHSLGDPYREDSIVIEPGTNHFDLERPEMVAKHVEALLRSIPAGEGRGVPARA
jgi:pimeloyl-ACP methyl ester carboxylesterase